MGKIKKHATLKPFRLVTASIYGYKLPVVTYIAIPNEKAAIEMFANHGKGGLRTP